LALVLFATGLLTCVCEVHGANPSRSQRAKNAQRSAAAKAKALDSAIRAGKDRLQKAQAAANAASQRYLALQSNANQSEQRKLSARVELADADNEKYGSSQELDELRAKIEKFEADGSPLHQARTEYEAAREEMAEIRADIYASDKYLALYDGAMKSPNKSKELERVTEICFEEDTDYKAAKLRVGSARQRYNEIRYKLYEEHPDWAAAVERAKAATVAANKAATSFKSSAIESGIERISAREAYQRHAAAQASLADAKQDLSRLEAQKKKMQPKPTASSQSAKSKKK
jgi:chromosome segregation ATPase